MNYKRKVHLLNAAVMPHSGTYVIEEVLIDEFRHILKDCIESEEYEFKHYIGYENTLKLIETICDVQLGEINVEQTQLEDRDVILIARLNRRLTPDDKIRTLPKNKLDLTIEDFEFYEGQYYAQCNIL